MIAVIRRRKITVESVAPALEAALEWAGTDEGRLDMTTIHAYVDMVAACDAVQEADRE